MYSQVSIDNQSTIVKVSHHHHHRTQVIIVIPLLLSMYVDLIALSNGISETVLHFVLVACLIGIWWNGEEIFIMPDAFA